jgi:hypothetical protein
MNDLKNYLANIEPGKVVDDFELESLLEKQWNTLAGSDDGGMNADKLLGRMEDIDWDPPFVSFVIERHGARCCGSSRAELQCWRVNVNEQTAQMGTIEHRQLAPMATLIRTGPIAEELARLIIEGKDDERLKRRPNGLVELRMGKIFPATGPKQTVAGRRKRLRRDIEPLLAEHGMVKVRANVFQRIAADQAIVTINDAESKKTLRSKIHDYHTT